MFFKKTVFTLLLSLSVFSLVACSSKDDKEDSVKESQAPSREPEMTKEPETIAPTSTVAPTISPTKDTSVTNSPDNKGMVGEVIDGATDGVTDIVDGVGDGITDIADGVEDGVNSVTSDRNNNSNR